MIYFNNAATTWPKPSAVIDTVRKVVEEPVFEHGRATTRDAMDFVELGREETARFFSVKNPDHILFTANATDSLNKLIWGWAKKHPDPFHVVTTSFEHNSVLRPLRTLERDKRCTLQIFRPAETRVNPDSFLEQIPKDTRLVVLGHGSNVLGSVQDIGTIGRELQHRGIFFIVDGAQTAGQYPVDLSKTPVDAFAFTGHKYLFGIPGTGGFFLQDKDQVAATQQGGTGVDSKAPYQSEELPLKFEAGTPNYPGIASLYAGIKYLRETGLDKIMSHTSRMTKFLVSEISSVENVSVFNPDPDLPVISFNIDGMENEDAGIILTKAYQIVCRTGLHCAPLVHEIFDGSKGSVRFSLSFHNTLEECQIAAEAVREIAKTTLE